MSKIFYNTTVTSIESRTYLLDLLLVSLLQAGDVVCPLLGFLDLLPGLHLLLLQKGNTIGQQLSISVDTASNKG